MTWIIIPAYNEGQNLPGVVHGIASTLRDGYRVFIINDGSKDDTLQVVQALAKSYPVTLLDHVHNKGVAEAFRTGITAVIATAKKEDVVVIMEGDGTSDVKLLPEMVASIRAGADVVIASRYCGSGQYRNFPIKRLLLSKVANAVFRLLFPVVGVRDYSIFYRAYQAGVLQAAMRAHGEKFITVQTFFANIEILLNLRPWLSRVEEVALVYDYGQKKGKSGMKIWKNVRSYILFIVTHAFRSPA
ncbi:MAG: glycosyltransferase family 2 protein [Candidatus Andersenbacteria bacterium]|nr:glycosyltransferase family 2 protein [Candidatus Andersenbacteria bacterium]